MRSSDSGRRRAAFVVSDYILGSVVCVALILASGAGHPQQSAETMPANISNRPAAKSDQAGAGAPEENAQANSSLGGQGAQSKSGGASAALWPLRPAGLRAANQTANQTVDQATWSRIFNATRPNRQAAALFQGRSCPPQSLIAQTSGQAPLSFQQSMRLALENNYNVLIAREQTAGAATVVTAAEQARGARGGEAGRARTDDVARPGRRRSDG